jgi:dipeptidyl aminopeptidase/acylaminoacyl peptidase
MLADGKRFVWLSDRSGSPQLYLYQIDGRLIATLTPDTLLAISAIAEDEVRGWLYWTALANGPRADTHLYRIRLDGTELGRLTEEAGRHDIQLAPSGSFFIDTHSSAIRPPSVDLRRADGTLVRTLATADITELEKLGWEPPEEFVVTAADGVTQVYGVLYKPHDFDSGGRYPVIDQIYLAATGALDAPRDFFTATWAPALAQLGFIVVRLDWRGSLAGGSLRKSIYGNIGRYEIPDHVAALEQLAAQRPYMDMSRVGIFGGSYGGYIALRAMLQAPGFFDVGIASAPITDMAEHYGNEIAVGPIETSREAYEYASNIPLAKNLRGKLLLVHGTCDAAVPLSHTIRIIEEFTRTGRPYDLILMPGEDHGGWSPSNAAYFLDARRRYFVEHLKP